jgi:hypothetical protein
MERLQRVLHDLQAVEQRSRPSIQNERTARQIQQMKFLALFEKTWETGFYSGASIRY